LAEVETPQKRDDRWDTARRKWEKEGVRQWDFDEIPVSIVVSGSGKGERLAYPALVADPRGGPTVSLRLMPSRKEAVVKHRRGVAVLLEKEVGREMKFLQKTLRLPTDLRPAARAFGGSAAVENRLLARVRTDLLERNIRTRKAFTEQAEIAYRKMIPVGRRLAESTVAVLRAYAQWVATLSLLQQAHRANRSVWALLAALDREIRRLVPDHFVALYAPERMEDLVRYIAAARLRAERAPLDPEKDRRKALPVQRFTEALQGLLDELSPVSTDEKRREVENFFWMIEEFKISIFAQELGTRMPVSQKRLEKKLQEIRRMV
jgi:ATP-dependent helicase HrpA